MLDQALAALGAANPTAHAAFELHARGLSYGEIADALWDRLRQRDGARRLSVADVDNRLRRARQILKEAVIVRVREECGPDAVREELGSLLPLLAAQLGQRLATAARG